MTDRDRSALKKLLQERGYRFGKSTEKLRSDLARLLGNERVEAMAVSHLAVARAEEPIGRIYDCLRTAEEANLFASRQADLSLAVYGELGERLAGDVKPGARIVDLGCWSGVFASWLAGQHPAARVFGVDRLERALEWSKAGGPPVNAEFAAWDYASAAPPPIAACDFLVSAFGLDFAAAARDVDPRDPPFFSLDAGVPRDSPVYRFRRAEAAPCLAGWRRVARSGAVLWAALRIPTFEKCLAFVDAAHAAGWAWEPTQPSKLRTEDEAIPLLRLRAGEPVDPPDADLLLSWWAEKEIQAFFARPIEGDLALALYRSLGGRRVLAVDDSTTGRLVVRRELGVAGALAYVLVQGSSGSPLLFVHPRHWAGHSGGPGEGRAAGADRA